MMIFYMFLSKNKTKPAEMLRHSPRLSSNGYSDNKDHMIQRISYKETPVRIFKKRKPNHREGTDSHNLSSRVDMHDLQNLQSRGLMLTSPQHAPLPSRCSTFVRQYGLLSFSFFVGLGFGVWLCHMCSGSNEHLLHEINSLRQIVTHQKEADEKEIRLLNMMLAELPLEKEKAEEIIRTALSRYRADDIGMADYALASLGATVIDSTETYITRYCQLFGFSVSCRNYGPETVIQPEVHPGKCWGFRGHQGHLVISLAYPVRITHVSLEHLPRVLSPTGEIRSAPRDFAVYGMVKEKDEGKLLGKFTYDQDGEPIQTFELTDSPSEVYGLVKLKILSNWGQPEYTCVYRFRVHSQPRSKQEM